MSSTEHPHGIGAGSSFEKISALNRQLEDLRAENDLLTCEKAYLEEVSSLEQQIAKLRSENERLALANESLRVKTTGHSAEASSSGTAVCEDPDYLTQELNRVREVALELGLSLQEPSKPYELSILCSVICHKEKLANLKCFLRDHIGMPDMTGGSICLEQTASTYSGMHIVIIGSNRTRCQAHEDNNNDCVWISRRGPGWIVGSGRV